MMALDVFDSVTDCSIQINTPSHSDEVTRIVRMCDPLENTLFLSCLRWLFCYASCVVSWPRWSTTVDLKLLWRSGDGMLGGAFFSVLEFAMWCQHSFRELGVS